MYETIFIALDRVCKTSSFPFGLGVVFSARTSDVRNTHFRPTNNRMSRSDPSFPTNAVGGTTQLREMSSARQMNRA